jgi:hypothetical protein
VKEVTMDMKEKPKRVQFDFSPETWELVEQLRLQINASSKAEVIRRSIALYAWFQQEVKPDDFVEVQDKKGKITYKMQGKFFGF